jgi:cyanophycinase-like exopeptidase
MDDSGLVNRRDAYQPGVVRRLENADLVLITGGSPERVYDCTVDTPALHALRVASDRGAVIAGCSAGAIVVGAGMPIGAADDRRPGRFWELIRRTVVAPHFGRYDIKPWLRSFPECVVLGLGI